MSTREKRRLGRERVKLGARVYVPGDRAGLGCAVRDLSVSGARLSFVDLPVLPDTFTLALSATGERCEVMVRWRRGREVGVEFLQRETLDLCWEPSTDRREPLSTAH